MDLELLRERWVDERPKYDALCRRVKCKLQAATWNLGISCEILARTKEPDSLLKKALRKGYEDPYEEIRDKAGVRIICTYRDLLIQLEDVVRDLFDVCDYENKSISLGYDRLGYSGIHFEIRLRTEVAGVSEELAGLVCEVQLLTRAQSLWADISHELAYKPAQDPPEEIKRAIHLQGALIELFDNQITQARNELLNLEGFQEASMLDSLDKHFFRFTAERYDRELSLHILGRLHPLFSRGEIQAFSPLLDRFVEQKMETLSSVFKDYADDDRRNPLLYQPESIVIFMCLERDMFNLKKTWKEFLPLELLQGLAEVWGVDVGIVP